MTSLWNIKEGKMELNVVNEIRKEFKKSEILISDIIFDINYFKNLLNDLLTDKCECKGGKEKNDIRIKNALIMLERNKSKLLEEEKIKKIIICKLEIYYTKYKKIIEENEDFHKFLNIDPETKLPNKLFYEMNYNKKKNLYSVKIKEAENILSFGVLLLKYIYNIEIKNPKKVDEILEVNKIGIHHICRISDNEFRILTDMKDGQIEKALNNVKTHLEKETVGFRVKGYNYNKYG